MVASAEQLTALLQYCMDFARSMLEKAGDFYPFGGSISPGGTVGAVGGYDSNSHPKPQEIYQLLSTAFLASAKNGDYLGVALAANVNIPAQFEPPFPDGIRVHVESEGYARLIYIPYKITTSGLFTKKRSVSFGEMFAVEVAPAFFTGGGSA